MVQGGMEGMRDPGKFLCKVTLGQSILGRGPRVQKT